MSSARRFAPTAFVALLVGALTLPALAATSGGMSDAFKGFGSNGKDPIQIEADSL